MAEKNLKVRRFFRRNLVYFIFLIILTAVTVTAIILVVSSEKSKINQVDKNKEIEQPVEDPKPSQPEDDKPTSNIVVFDLPVSGNVILEKVDAYCFEQNELAGGKIQMICSGHDAIDIAAAEGTNVKCCYDGKIISIVETENEGKVLTIDHGDNLLSIYKNINVNENLKANDIVKKGDVIGVVSNSYKKEQTLESHLHFQVKENGQFIDPMTYLNIEEK